MEAGRFSRIGAVRRFAVAAAVLAASFASIAFTRDEAVALYRASFKDTPPSVQEAGDYIFIILEGSLSDSRDGNLIPVIMSGQLAALEKYIGRPSGNEISPLPGPIAAVIMPLAPFKIPECASCEVDETRYVGKYRHVSAFEAAPIKKAREDAVAGMPVKRTLDEWESLLRSYILALKHFRDRERVWLELGSSTRLLMPNGGVAYRGWGVDLAEIGNLYATWGGDADRRACDGALEVDRAFSQAHARLSAIEEGEGDIPRALSRALKSSLAAPNAERVAELAAKAGGTGAFGEFASLYGECLEKAGSFKSGGAKFWGYCLNTFGFLEFGKGDSGEDAGFSDAKRLFHTGGAGLEEVMGMIRASIEKAPASSEKWRYLAACFRAGGNLHDAVVAYHQALVINPGDETAAADLCLLYQKLGLTKLADGNAWHLLVSGRDESAKAKARSVISANHGSELE